MRQRCASTVSSMGSRAPEMIPAYKRLDAGPNLCASEVFAELDRLIYAPVPVAEVRALRRTEMDAEALLRAAARMSAYSSPLKFKWRRR